MGTAENIYYNSPEYSWKQLRILVNNWEYLQDSEYLWEKLRIFMRKTENIYDKNWEYLWEKLRIFMKTTESTENIYKILENIYVNYWTRFEKH